MLTFAGLLLVTSFSKAQVKMGANPGTIGTNSGLEVEATNGNKTIVNKATGQVTIQDGTQGAGKSLTSDANGGSSWASPAVIKQNLGIAGAFRAFNTVGQAVGASTTVYVELNSETYDELNNFAIGSSPTLTVTETGTWQFNGATILYITTGSNAITFSISKSSDGGSTWTGVGSTAFVSVPTGGFQLTVGGLA